MKPAFIQTRNSASPREHGGTFLIVLAMVSAVVAALGLGAASFLQQSRDTRALRACLLGGQKLAWQNRIVINAGPVTFAAVRLVSRFLDLPQEARAGVASLRGAEVGVFRGGHVAPEDRPAALAKAEETMLKRGWSRVVAVHDRRESVTVYVQERGAGANNLVCCAVIWNENELVVVRVKSDPEPLLKLVGDKLRRESRLQLRERHQAER